MKIEVMVSKRFRNKRTNTKRECKMVCVNAYKRAVDSRLLFSFKRLYRDNKCKLPFEFYIHARYKCYFILKIKGVNPVISVKLGRDEMDLWASKNKLTDILAMIYTSPVREGNFYRCKACADGGVDVRYSSMDELWADDLFKQCVETIEKHVLTAERIRFYFNEHGSGWVSLEQNEIECEPDDVFILRYDLPVHIGK